MGMSTVKRNSVRKSMAPGSQGPSSARRSSQYGRPSMGMNNTSSFFTTVKTSVQKDTRPLKNAQYKQKMATEVMEYLLENNFEMDMKYQLPHNALQSPTQKDFYHIFQWLYKRLDPGYEFTSPKPETEVMPQLANLRYPYSNSITKTQLTAVGSGNTWPTLLGMLHWMMELAQITDAYRNGDFDAAAEQEGVGIESEKIVFRYMSKCYNAWLAENDDHEEFEQEMQQAFEERDAGFLEELHQLEIENAAIKKELEDLNESHQPLQKLQEEKAVLEEDAKKFGIYISAMDAKMQRYTENIEKIKKEIVTAQAELEKTEKQKATLQAQVDAQGLTPQDIDRMNSEREKLNQGLAQITSKLIETQEKLNTQVAQAQSKLEGLERAVSRYNTLAYKIGITPSTAPKAKGKEYELQILPLQDFEGSQGENKLVADSRTGYQPSQILNVDLRHEVRPFLEKLRQEIGVNINNAVDESMKHAELIDRVTEALADKKDELETLEVKVRAVNNEYQELKDTMQEEINMSNAEMEKQAANLQQMRVNMSKGALEAEQKLQSISIEYDEFLQARIHLREKLHSETQKIVAEVVDFKIHVQQSLEEFEERVDKAAQENSAPPPL
ncbi:HEC/Ndc80p family-domain-containing protein [Trichophaea hybrida]|nr:HEC/Ndc80p family-domain-containing protein [Trichophaea hybrida]